MKDKKNGIVLAYSGGLDTTYAIKYLTNIGYKVVATIINFGDKKDYKLLKDRALKIGAIKCNIINVKDEFVDEYILHAIYNNALYENQYPLISALSRPLISKHLVKIANDENIKKIAHGCTAKGNDQVRFNISIKALNPDIDIIMPMKDCQTSRNEIIKKLKEYNFSLSEFSIDENIWGRSCECGKIIENPWKKPPKNAYGLTNDPVKAPNKPEIIEIGFKCGKPNSINNVKMKLSEIITKLNEIAGKHGIGRIDMLENRLIGIKSREIYEAPAAITIINAHKALEDLTMMKNLIKFKKIIENKFSELVYNGLWYSPLKDAIMKFTIETQKFVSGTVKIELYKGNANVIGRKSENSLYDLELATYDKNDKFNHSSSSGFMEIFGLPIVTYSRLKKKLGNKNE